MPSTSNVSPLFIDTSNVNSLGISLLLNTNFGNKSKNFPFQKMAVCRDGKEHKKKKCGDYRNVEPYILFTKDAIKQYEFDLIIGFLMDIIRVPQIPQIHMLIITKVINPYILLGRLISLFVF